MPPLPPQDLDHVLKHAGDALKALAGSRIFITGGTGFVGSWLVESLLDANGRLKLGVSVVALSRNPQRFYETNPSIASHPNLQLLQGNVQSFEFPAGEFPLVIHAAPPDPDLEADAQGIERVLDFAGTHGTRRFLFTSSGAVYGRQPPEMTRVPEDYSPAPSEAATPYALAKRESESRCLRSGRQFGFDPLIARLFAFTGPRLPLDANFAAGNFIRDILAGGPIRITGDGTPYRSYLYAADLAVWLWTVLLRGEPGKPYNVGSGDGVTIAELARVVASVTEPGTPVEIGQKPVPGAPAARYVPCVERAGRELGLRPVIALKEGVQRMYQWAREMERDSSTTSTYSRSR